MKFHFQPSHRIFWACSSILFIGILLLAFYIHSHTNKIATIETSQRYTNIQYCNDKNPGRALDIYVPKNAQKNIPLLVFIHGGGWRQGHRGGKLVQTYGNEAIRRGIAVADIGYELNTAHPYPDENNDVACALTWLSNNASTYGIDVEKMVYFGDSAGGQLAAFAALTIPYKGYDYEAPIGVIDLYGVSDFTKILEGKKPDKNAQLYLGSNYNTHAVDASPTNYVTKNAPTFLIIHGNKDTVVPISQSKELFDKLTKFGIDAEFIEINGGRHGFIGPELSRTESKKLYTSINTYLMETVGR